jgi:hypothetical protein
MGLVSTLAMAITATLDKQLDLAVATVPLSKTYSVALANGSATGQADLIFHDTRTLAPSANEDLDLAGVLSDAVCTVLTYVRVKGLFIASAANNVNTVVVGAAAANPWIGLLNATGTVTLRPGGVFGYMAGIADPTASPVVAATGDLLRVTNGGAGTSINYDIIVIGSSA